MRLHYDASTDSLDIELSPRPGADAREIADGVVLDLDASGAPVGIDIQHASRVIDLTRLETHGVPVG